MGQPLDSTPVNAAGTCPDGQFDAQHQSSGGSKVAASPSTCGDEQLPRITERLAFRVKGLQGDCKGLTALFRVLLLTNPARPRRPAGFQAASRLRQNVFWWQRTDEIFKR
jgi:hypothetical protein